MRQIFPLLASNYTKSGISVGTIQQLSNFYLEEYPPAVNNKVPIMALPTPGFTQWWNLSGSTVRGMIAHKDNIYVAVDNKAYKINVTNGFPNTITQIGTFNTSVKRMSISATDSTIVFVDYDGTASSAVFYYNENTSTFGTVSQGQFNDLVSSAVCYAGYTLYLIQKSKTVQVSNLNDATTVGGLSQFQANSFYDNIQAIVASENYIYLLSDIALEVWYLSGAAPVPFGRVSGGILQYGILNAYSYSVIGDNLFFMANDLNGFIGPAMCNGPNYQPIMNLDLISKIKGYTLLSQTNSYSWADNVNGHTFWNTTFPLSDQTRGHTWSLDTSTLNQSIGYYTSGQYNPNHAGVWLERSCYNPVGVATPGPDQHVASCHAFIQGAQLIGDFYSGKIYSLSSNLFTDNGQIITRTLTSPHLFDRNAYFSLYNLQIDIELSQGLPSGQGSSPQIMIQWSKDEGRTWSPEVWRTASVLGQTKARVRIGSLGRTRGYFTVRINVSDPINWVISSASVEIEKQEPSYMRMIGIE